MPRRHELRVATHDEERQGMCSTRIRSRTDGLSGGESVRRRCRVLRGRRLLGTGQGRSDREVVGCGVMAGKLLRDEPAEGVLRLTISNPDKRGALDHAILDAVTEQVAGAAAAGARCIVLTGEGQWFSSGYDIGDIPADVFAVEAERIVAHPFTEASAGARRDRPPDRRRDQRAGDRRRPRVRARVRSARRRAGRAVRHAAGQARARLLAHRHPALHRRDRRAARAGAVPRRPPHLAPRRRSRGAS